MNLTKLQKNWLATDYELF